MTFSEILRRASHYKGIRQSKRIKFKTTGHAPHQQTSEPQFMTLQWKTCYLKMRLRSGTAAAVETLKFASTWLNISLSEFSTHKHIIHYAHIWPACSVTVWVSELTEIRSISHFVCSIKKWYKCAYYCILKKSDMFVVKTTKSLRGNKKKKVSLCCYNTCSSYSVFSHCGTKHGS